MHSAAGVSPQEVLSPEKCSEEAEIPPQAPTQDLYIWGGISKSGATCLVMFTGIMNATKYGDILSVSLLPFLRKHYPNFHRLYQNNDPNHASRYIQAFLQVMGSTAGRA